MEDFKQIDYCNGSIIYPIEGNKKFPGSARVDDEGDAAVNGANTTAVRLSGDYVEGMYTSSSVGSNIRLTSNFLSSFVDISQTGWFACQRSYIWAD